MGAVLQVSPNRRRRERPLMVVACIGCGCDDLHACDDAMGGACHWVAVNHDTRRGVCSECAHRMLQAMLMPPETSEHWPRPSRALPAKGVSAMSRSGYSDDCENIDLWRGAVNRAIRGRRGQAFLKELLAALDALSEKRLIAGALIEGAEVCAIGSVGRQRGIDMLKLDPEDPDGIAKAFGIAPALVQEIEFMNDDDFCYRRVTDEERYHCMRVWVEAQITP